MDTGPLKRSFSTLVTKKLLNRLHVSPQIIGCIHAVTHVHIGE
jgi:hypothetical protein